MCFQDRMKIQYCPPGPSLASRGTTGHTFLLASQGPMDGTPWCTSKGREKSQELLPWGQLSDSCDPMGAPPCRGATRHGLGRGPSTAAFGAVRPLSPSQTTPSLPPSIPSCIPSVGVGARHTVTLLSQGPVWRLGGRKGHGDTQIVTHSDREEQAW